MRSGNQRHHSRIHNTHLQISPTTPLNYLGIIEQVPTICPILDVEKLLIASTNPSSLLTLIPSMISTGVKTAGLGAADHSLLDLKFVTMF